MSSPLGPKSRRKQEERIARLGQCEEEWYSRIPDPEGDHLHKCMRFKGHRSAHKCNCGASHKCYSESS